MLQKVLAWRARVVRFFNYTIRTVSSRLVSMRSLIIFVHWQPYLRWYAGCVVEWGARSQPILQ